jgi:hypothetical protein
MSLWDYRNFLKPFVNVASFPMGKIAQMIQRLRGYTGTAFPDAVSVVRPEPTSTKVQVINLIGTADGISGRLPTAMSGSSTYEYSFEYKGVDTQPIENYGHFQIFFGATWFDLNYDIATDKFSVTNASGTLVSDVFDLHDNEWHTVVLRISATYVKLTVDGTPIIDTASTDFTPVGIDYSFSIVSNYAVQGYVHNIRLVQDPDTTAASVFHLTCEEGAGAYLSTGHDEYCFDVKLGASSYVGYWNSSSDETPSFNLTNGYADAVSFYSNGSLKEQAVTSGTGITNFGIRVYVTGASNQYVASHQHTNSAFNMVVNEPGSNSKFVISNFTLGSYIFGDPASKIPKGWHTIVGIWQGAGLGYKCEIDGVQQVSRGTYNGQFTHGRWAVGSYSGAGWEELVTDFYYVRADAHREDVIVDGKVVVSLPEWASAGGVATVALKPNANGLAPTDRPLSGISGPVHNQADVGMIQNDDGIVDGLLVSNVTHFPGQGSILLPRTGDQTWSDQWFGSTLTVSYNSGLARWEISYSSQSDNQAVTGPLPPKAAWPNSWVIEHGYNGSFWVDADGEFVEHDWDSLFAHSTTDENLNARYEKNDLDYCQLMELIQHTMTYETYTADDLDVIAEWQGTSGCETPVA